MEGNPACEAPYRAIFGGDRMDYVIPAGSTELIVLNNAGCFHVTPERREARYLFSGSGPAQPPRRPQDPGLPHPAHPAARAPYILRESFGFLSWHNLEAELLDRLDASGPSVKFVISGHLHLTGMVMRRGIAHLATAGTASFPHDIAVVDVRDNRIDVEVIALPVDLHEPADQSPRPPALPTRLHRPRPSRPPHLPPRHPLRRRFSVMY